MTKSIWDPGLGDSTAVNCALAVRHQGGDEGNGLGKQKNGGVGLKIKRLPCSRFWYHGGTERPESNVRMRMVRPHGRIGRMRMARGSCSA